MELKDWLFRISEGQKEIMNLLLNASSFEYQARKFYPLEHSKALDV